MAALAANNPTLMDLATRQDPDGKIAKIIEMLTQTNEMLLDIPWVECNNGTSHKTTVRTGLPEPTWRKIYGYVQPTKSTTAQVTETTGNLEAFAEVDRDLADLNGNTAAFRLSEDKAHIEGMNQEVQQTMLFGNEGSAPEEFTGIAPRYNDRSGPANADNIIHGGGSGNDNGSIWLIIWDETTVHGLYPKGFVGGLQHEDLGLDVKSDANGGLMRVYRSHYKWTCGISVRDWRYAVRICNIDKSELSTRWNNGQFVASDGTTAQGANLPDLMFQAIERIPNLSMGRAAFYMSRDMRTKLRQQLAASVQGSTLTVENVGGVRTMLFNEIPVRRVDAMAADEALVGT